MIPADGPLVTAEAVNAFVWRKQRLSPDGVERDVVGVVRDVLALHATAALTPYLSLRARLAGFAPAQLDAELYERRRLVKVLCMRHTVHVLAVRDVPLVTAATGERLQRAARRELGQLLRWAGVAPGEEESTLARLQEAIAAIIAARGPCTAAELSQALPELQQRIAYAPDKPYGGEVSLGSMLLPRLTALGFLVRGRPRGSWRSNLYEWALPQDWLPPGEGPAMSPEEARAQLLRRYLAAFGPATLEDAAWWAGWSKREAERALAALEPEVAPVRIAELGSGFRVLAADLPGLLAAPPLPAGSAQLLPFLDGYAMAYADRRRFLAPDHQRQAVDRSGNVLNSVWSDGRMVGIWREGPDCLECLLWEEGHSDAIAAAAEPVSLFLQQGDGGKRAAPLPVVVRPYPPGLYAKTPFTLGQD